MIDPFAAAAQTRKELGLPTEAERILDLEVWDPSPQEQAAFAEKWTIELSLREHGKTLRPIQGLALETAHRASKVPRLGMLANVGVGAGKTWAFILIPTVLGATKVCYMVPPDQVEAAETALWEMRQVFNVVFDFTVLSYGKLSNPKASAYLRKQGFDLIMADECQALKNATASRTKRLLRYMNDRPDTRFVGMSGTLASRGPKDFGVLAELACREFSPLPIEDEVMDRWNSVLSDDGEPDDDAWHALIPIVRAFGDDPNWLPGRQLEELDKTVARQAFAKRFLTSPFTFGTLNPSVDIPMTIQTVHVPLSDECRKLASMMMDDEEGFVLPNGQELAASAQAADAAKQLCMGFYYIWDWDALGIPPDEEWLEARKEWHKQLRAYLKVHSREGRDSPMLVSNWLSREHNAGKQRKLPRMLYASWLTWQDHKDKPKPPTKAIWLDTTPLTWATQEWTKTARNGRGIIWFRSRAVGTMLKAMGIPTFWKGTPGKDLPFIALSTKVYHKGKNFLVHWSDQLILEPTSGGLVVEQQLGREHRPGQLDDLVNCDIARTHWVTDNTLKKLVRNSHALQEMTAQPQRLLLPTTTLDLEAHRWGRRNQS